MQPDFYSDMESAGKILQKIKGLKDKRDRFNELETTHEDLTTLVALAIEEDDESVLDEVKQGYKELSENLENMKLETLLSGKYDANNAIVTLEPAAPRRRTGARCCLGCTRCGRSAEGSSTR